MTAESHAARRDEGDVATRPDELGETRQQAALFVWGVWIAATVIAGAWVARHARRFPYSDDWEIVQVITGERSLTPGWLWSLGGAGEHRLVVPRLVISGLTTLSDGDFRVTVWLNLLLLTGTAALAILTMRRVRGYTTLSDAFFPLVLLSLLQAGLNWGFHVHFVSLGVASVLVLLIMIRFGLDVPARWLWVAAALMLVLLGGGAPGLALLPGLLAWLVLSALRLRQAAPKSATALISLVGLFVVGFGLYFVGYSGSGVPRASPSETVSTVLRLGTTPGGTRVSDFWPLAGVAVATALVATTVVLALRYRTTLPNTSQRGQFVALICFGLALGMLLLAIGIGRGNLPWKPANGQHFSALVLPLFCWIYVVWDRAGSRLRAGAGMMLLGLAIVAYASNAGFMRRVGGAQARLERAVQSDLCELEPEALARRHIRLFSSGYSPVIADGIEAMRRRGMGPFDCGSSARESDETKR